MENKREQEIRYREAEKRMKKIKGFYIHAIVYFCVNVFIVASKAIDREQGENFWDWDLISLPFFWGIGLAAHGLSVFLPTFILGKDWEEKKIKELMNKNK
ncbi:2TM domain-containing protein [Chryseobacterium wangxinyae]|uniref:2TM domain-containing protein n=1 Tax=unclassified Chryseobacterium TaxID=2593645 RepID=UPI00226F0C8A|nr:MULTISPECIES: 2TM domain-containing protein [unclassified Chryseobacterium]MCY0969044.1 2TM domain-containing protein [Chryseobacterium sp. CY353]MCY0976067.1 2TM domain-containing protein [Chryseobacterium sp. CY350]WBZ94333.1 2TM domain-containing protein [Chryseobacterium sp. CY350]